MHIETFADLRVYSLVCGGLGAIAIILIYIVAALIRAEIQARRERARLRASRSVLIR